MFPKWARFSFSVAVAALLLPQASQAEMLDEPACNALKNEQARLAAAGLKTEMLQGPDWAKANLPPSRLQEIKHLMEVEEQINFRCPLPPPPKPPQPAIDAAGVDGKGEPKVTKKKGKKQREEAVFEIPQLDLPTPDAEAPAEKPVKAKTKPKAKKKEQTNDAYVPPPAQGNAFVDGEAEPVPKSPSSAQ